MIKRDVIEKIDIFLNTDDILLFYGARQVWKTTLMKYIQDNYFKDNSIFFDLEKESNLDLLNRWWDIFVEYLKSYNEWNENKKIVVFVDEIQYLENPTSFLKYVHDNYKNIKFIVSWSSTLDIRWKLKDSLVWRLIKFDIYPLNFSEFLRFKGKNNLSKLIWKQIELEIINEEVKFFFEEYVKFWCYPKVVLNNNINVKIEYLKQIYSTYIEKDIKDIWKIVEVNKFNKLLKILANQSWNLINISELSNTIWATIKTINNWLFLLENTFVIKIITPFSSNIRWELTKMPKIFFIDNGIKNYIDNNFELNWNNFETSIFNYFNNMCIVDKIQFYRTQDKKEIDFIIDNKPIEVKLAYNWKNVTALDYFWRHYNEKWHIITLSKKSNNRYNILYPWEFTL